MVVLGGYTLDMHNHGHLVREMLPVRVAGQDYGANPLGDGTFRMIPSGDIVDLIWVVASIVFFWSALTRRS